MQNVVLGHDTPLRLLSWFVLGLGLAMIDQARPSHCSTNGCIRLRFGDQLPTAMQNVALAHDTADNDPEVVGLPTSDQRRPFHRSTSGSPRLVFHQLPTATQKVALTHDTPDSPAL